MNISNDIFVDGFISGGANTSSTFAYLTLTSTDEAVNMTSGSMVTFGGITIQCESKANDIGNGGSFLTAGGGSFGKNLIIGSTENSIGIGSGGSFTVLGGASISKDLIVGGSITSSSDIRLKTNIKELGNVLDKIDDIQCVTYNNISDNNINDIYPKKYIGFLAQNFEKNFPELLRRANNDN